MEEKQLLVISCGIEKNYTGALLNCFVFIPDRSSMFLVVLENQM